MVTVIEWSQSKNKWFCKVKCKLTYFKKGKGKAFKCFGLFLFLFFFGSSNSSKGESGLQLIILSRENFAIPFFFFLFLLLDIKKKKKKHVKSEKWFHSDGNGETLSLGLKPTLHRWFRNIRENCKKKFH